MNVSDFSAWPAALAQADNSPAPASAPAGAPADHSPAPAAGDGTTTTQGADGTPAGGQTQPQGNPFGGILIPMILVLGVLFIFSMGSGRKEKKRRAQLLADLSKGAKVQTVGGVLGTVVEVRDDEVLVKVDENSNTRMRFAKSAISTVLSED
ncbi:MAG: preprotein translocase subunit YajC [Planctomycetota bacterium]